MWHTPESAREQWLEAPDESDDPILAELLEVAREAVVAYAPELDDPLAVPTSYRLAQLMQARSVWNAQRTGTEAVGPDGFAIRVYPLDKNIRQLLRPRQVIGGIF